MLMRAPQAQAAVRVLCVLCNSRGEIGFGPVEHCGEIVVERVANRGL
jgi:hypothetical protein